MRRHTTLLICSDHLGWVGVRKALEERRDVCIVGDVTHARQAVKLTVKLRPDAILIAAEMDGASTAPLIAQLHSCCATSKIIVLGEEHEFERYASLFHAGIASYLTWNNLSPTRLHRSLDAVLEADLVVSSRATARVLFKRDECRRGLSALALSAREQAVLGGLLMGLSRPQIATAQRCSVRTVERAIASLAMKLDAPSKVALGMQATRRGLIP